MFGCWLRQKIFFSPPTNWILQAPPVTDSVPNWEHSDWRQQVACCYFLLSSSLIAFVPVPITWRTKWKLYRTENSTSDGIMSPPSLLFDSVARQVFFSRGRERFFFFFKLLWIWRKWWLQFHLAYATPLAYSPIKMTGFHHEAHQ